VLRLDIFVFIEKGQTSKIAYCHKINEHLQLEIYFSIVEPIDKSLYS